MERILLNPSEWWIGKKDGKLLAVMFARRAKDGVLNIEWEVLDESNLPVDLVRRDGEEYAFILPVGLDRDTIKEVGKCGRVDSPRTATDTCSRFAWTPPNINPVPRAGGVCDNDITDRGPVEGVSTHGDSVVLNSSTNVKVHTPLPATASDETGVKP